MLSFYGILLKVLPEAEKRIKNVRLRYKPTGKAQSKAQKTAWVEKLLTEVDIDRWRKKLDRNTKKSVRCQIFDA